MGIISIVMSAPCLPLRLVAIFLPWFLSGQLLEATYVSGTGGNASYVGSQTTLTDWSEGAHESNTTLFVVEESVDHYLSTDVWVATSANGTYGGGNPKPAHNINLKGEFIASYLVSTDPTAGSGSHTFTGSVTFSRPILGIIWSSAEIGNSDAALAVPGTLFGASSRGTLEGNSEFYTIAGNTVSFSFRVNHCCQDQIRIITAAAPEPSSALMASLAFVGVGFLNRRKRPSQS